MQGELSTATANEQFDHLVTLGIYTCKAISIHSLETETGVLAHLASTRNVEGSLQNIMNAYPADISTADIKVLQSVERRDDPMWPDLRTIARFFMQSSPRSLLLDINVSGGPIRGVALNLRTGVLHSPSRNDQHLANSTWHKIKRQRIKS